MNRPPSIHLARGEHEVQHLVAKDEFDDRARCLRMIQHRVEADGRGLSMVLNAGQRGLRLQPDPNGFGVERWKPRLNTGLQLPNVEIEQAQFGMSATAGGMKNHAHERRSDRRWFCNTRQPSPGPPSQTWGRGNNAFSSAYLTNL